MKDIFRILLISLLSFTIISCSAKDEGESSGSNIQLSDVKSNLSGKSLFITTGDSSSSSSRSSRSSKKTSSSSPSLSSRSSKKTSSSTHSLIVQDNNSNIDYGIISDYDLEIEQVRVDQNNEYAYLQMKYGGGHSNSNRDMNVRALNCTLFKVNLSTNEMSCVEPGLVVTGIYHNMIFGVNDYHLDPFQFGSEHTFVFRTDWSVDFSADSDLICSKSCIYEHNTQTGLTRRVSPYSYDGERFVALGDGNIIWSGMETNGNYDPNATYDSEILLTDTQGNTTELSSSPSGVFSGDFQGGDYKTTFWGSESQKTIVFARVVSGTIRKTFVSSDLYSVGVIKGDDGNIYGQFGGVGLYSILPYKVNPLVSTPELWKNKLKTIDCGGYSITCGIHFTIVNGIVFYNNYVVNSNIESYELKATRISDNTTVTLLSPNSTCTENCYKFNNLYLRDQTYYSYKWFVSNNKIYVPMMNINTNNEEMIELDPAAIDFNSTDNQFKIMSSLDDYTGNRVAKDISGINTIDSSSLNPTAEIKHEDNETISVRIEFNKKMNYSDVESKVSIIDNSSSSVIGFMPVWNNKTLHLVVDTDNGTSSTVESNPLTSGTTYKVSLLGTAKDSDGNALGSDVVKYITP
jgi:hypothetical protein